MKKAAEVFLAIGLLGSFVLTVIAIISLVASFSNKYASENIFYFLLGIGVYGIITSVGAFNALSGKSKGAIVVWAILYLPVIWLASIFMFGVDPLQNQKTGQASADSEVAQLGNSEISQPDNADISTQLERLAELHNNGALTDEEYSTAKSKILDL